MVNLVQKNIRIYDESLCPGIARHLEPGDYIYMDVHCADTTKDCIYRNGIRTMSWPSQSPIIKSQRKYVVIGEKKTLSTNWE